MALQAELQTQDEAGGVGRTGLDRPPVALQDLSEVDHHRDGCRGEEHNIRLDYQPSLDSTACMHVQKLRWGGIHALKPHQDRWLTAELRHALGESAAHGHRDSQSAVCPCGVLKS